MDKRYLQLYSVRSEIEKDFVGTLEKVSKIGYTGVEFYGGVYGGLKVGELKKLMTDLNLEPLSSHLGCAQVPKELDYAVELGLRFIIDPMAGMKTDEDALEFTKKLNETGKLCKDAGITFGYHNHRHEFMPGKDGTLMDTLILNTDPDLVCFQLDVGWATCAACDVPAFLNKYAGRFKMIHVKECSKVAGAEAMPDFAAFPKDENGHPIIPPEVLKKWQEQNQWNVAAGKGVIDWPKVRDAANAQGNEAFIIEREYDYLGDIIKCVEEDCVYLKSL